MEGAGSETPRGLPEGGSCYTRTLLIETRDRLGTWGPKEQPGFPGGQKGREDGAEGIARIGEGRGRIPQTFPRSWKGVKDPRSFSLLLAHLPLRISGEGGEFGVLESEFSLGIRNPREYSWLSMCFSTGMCGSVYLLLLWAFQTSPHATRVEWGVISQSLASLPSFALP